MILSKKEVGLLVKKARRKKALELILLQPDLMLNGELLLEDSKIALSNAIEMGLAYAEQIQKNRVSR